MTTETNDDGGDDDGGEYNRYYDPVEVYDAVVSTAGETAGGTTSRGVADRLGCNIRTARRWLKNFEADGYVEKNRRGKGLILWEPTETIPPFISDRSDADVTTEGGGAERLTVEESEQATLNDYYIKMPRLKPTPYDPEIETHGVELDPFTEAAREWRREHEPYEAEIPRKDE